MVFIRSRPKPKKHEVLPLTGGMLDDLREAANLLTDAQRYDFRSELKNQELAKRALDQIDSARRDILLAAYSLSCEYDRARRTMPRTMMLYFDRVRTRPSRFDLHEHTLRRTHTFDPQTCIICRSNEQLAAAEAGGDGAVRIEE